ncbi:DUF1524 domain-containing protein [Alteromonas sp. CI.11.F.A3]|uniref:GmrSD restriction endonuclease domain-containing protein n=1 Tax=Alteromonas sp. CI.11.F.A3 TaxID=3079555 RepID=UPI00397810A3
MPLKWAYEHGADDWSLALRREFANAPMNTIAVYGRANRSKGARGPSGWMPPNHYYRCEYLERFIAITTIYSLEFKHREVRVINQQLIACATEM